MTTLIAGIGNIFNRDDGFGSEVAQQLLRRNDWPADVRVEDYGIRGMHLALDLLDGCELLILVDAMARGDGPGTLYLLEPNPTGGDSAEPLDAHRMDPLSVLRQVHDLGGVISRVLVVGCEPVDIEDGIGLSAPVADAVGRAIHMVEQLIAERNTPCSVA